MTRQIHNSCQRWRRDASSTTNQPSTEPLARGAVVHRDPRIGVGVEGEVRRAPLCPDDCRDPVLVRGSGLILTLAAVKCESELASVENSLPPQLIDTSPTPPFWLTILLATSTA